MDTLKGRLAEGYSRSAPVYDALAGATYADGIRRLLPLVRVPPWPAVLDIGTGTGISLFEAMRCFGGARLAVGIDIAPGMLGVARAKARLLGLPAEFVLADAEALPFANGQFDLAIANSCFHWFSDKERALSEIARVLRPGGELVLIAAAAPCFQEWFAVLSNVLAGRFGPSAQVVLPTLPGAESLSGQLRSAGLTPRHLVVHRQPLLVSDPVRFTRILATVAPQWTVGLATEAQAVVEGEVSAWLRQHYPAGFWVTWAALEAIATRAPP